MLKRLTMGFLALALVMGLGAGIPAMADGGVCPPPPCNNCPPPPPPPPPCVKALNEIVVGTDIFVGDCGCCFDISARLLDDCSPCGEVIDGVSYEWCAGEPAPWLDVDGFGVFGPNGVLAIEDVAIVDGVANVVVRLFANPDVFDGGAFGAMPRAIEVTVNRRTNVCCAMFDCSLVVGQPLSIDWGWLWGGDLRNAKISFKSSAKAKVYVKGSASGKFKAKASAKSSLKIKLGSFKLSAKASAKASFKVGSSGISAKASAKSSLKIKGDAPPWLFGVAGSFAGAGGPFGGALAKAWAGWLTGAFAYAGPGPGGPIAVAIAGGPIAFPNVCHFTVLFLGGCGCGDCGDCGDCGGCSPCDGPNCPCTGPNCPPPPGPCGPCDGKVTSLTLRYSGPDATIRVDGKDGQVFTGLVAQGGSFTVTGNPTLGTNIYVFVNGTQAASIHTSCSQPIGPGQVFGAFTITAGASLEGGPLCAQPAGSTQTPKKKK